jgi:CRISPR-associated protein Csy3
MAKNENVVSVLSFEKKLVPSDGYFSGTTWSERHLGSTPLELIEKSVRGTISNRLKKTSEINLNPDFKNANLHTIDYCALGLDQDTLKIHFTLKILSNVEKPSACNNDEFNKSYAAAAKNYISEHSFVELAKRYAINIANARFLWRNRVGSENIEVSVKVLNGNNDHQWIFNASDYSLNDFDVSNEKIDSLASKIAQALSNEIPYLLLDINAYVQIGKAQQVYPSEELILDKGKSGKSNAKKSKVLFQINNIAGMHSQKIGNALRSIDTWYPDYNVMTGPIAIEPYGSVTTLGIAYRTPKNNSDFFTLFDKFARGETLELKEQEHYVMAVLIRGGVFGESSKELA